MCRLAFAVVFAAWSVSAFAGTCNIVNGRAYGDCKEVKVNNGQKGKLIITSVVAESGMIDGAEVKRGGSLKLSGMSIGNITVEEGAILEVNGTVNGTITNNGGEVRINGTARLIHVNRGMLEVSGTVDAVTGNGTITYKKGSVIGGKVIQ